MTRTSIPLVDALRSRARALGLNRAALARELGVSLSTIKRWLSGQGLDLAALERLLAALDLEWADLATLLPAQAAPRFQYTPEQEGFFARHPGYLAFFDALLAGEAPRAIARRHRLTQRSLQRYLRALERLALIDWLPGDRVKLRVSGEPQWRPGGALATAFRSRAIAEFLGANEPRFGLYRLLDADREKVETLWRELSDFVTSAERRARGRSGAVGSADGARGGREYGLLWACRPFRWSVLHEIPNLG